MSDTTIRFEVTGDSRAALESAARDIAEEFFGERNAERVSYRFDVASLAVTTGLSA